MRDLYQRLSARGFDVAFIRRAVLPDWWDDSLASNPANRAVAEMSIARLLGIEVAELRDRTAGISLPSVNNFRLKCRSGAKPDDIRPAVMVAKRIAQAIDRSLHSVPSYTGPVGAADIRGQILSHSETVNFQSLATYCWDSGIVVLHVSPTKLPGGRRFDGLACFIGNRPFIVLGSGKDSPPWLAFHLAHEIGHIHSEHVKPGDKPLVDSNLESVQDDHQERIANRFAAQILTGDPEPDLRFRDKPYPNKLAQAARDYGTRRNIDPGTVALLYARSNGFWANAQAAVKILGEAGGGRAAIADLLLQHVEIDSLPETTQRLLSCLSMSGV